ncbi:MAG: T9SS type A sorting domain-containing protein [Bacteroidales bacterium]|nr:T9SS type A sorting domain-containing protein [Bacteroidales bacterium]
MKKLFLTSVLLGLLARGFAQCPNLDLSYGNLTNWQCYVGSCSSGNYYKTPSPPTQGRHTVLEITSLMLSNSLYDENCNAIKKIPDGYSYSLKLGNDQSGAETEAVSYRMTVDSSNSLLILAFAYVMRGTHVSADMPRFTMNIYDTNWNILNVPCCNNNFVTAQGLSELACSDSIVARNWTTIGFSLESLIGQTIIIFFETRDCTQGGHYGYAYLACACQPMSISFTYNANSDVARLRAPDGFNTCQWKRSSQPNWSVSTQQINIKSPLDGEEFTCTLTSALGCSHTLKTVIEKPSIDSSDVEVTAFINPTDDETCSSVGTDIKVKVRVSNNHPDKDIQGVVLNAAVSADNTQIAGWTETLGDIASGSYIDFEFPQGFNVPAAADYTIVAYVNSIDTKSENDTLSVTKCTDLGVIGHNANTMSLGQNIPNPAHAQTVVNYTVPAEGTVIFTLTSITGQVITSTAQEAEAGRNSVVFNTGNLAAGIYFYTMDFNGQRLTKKMTVRKN